MRKLTSLILPTAVIVLSLPAYGDNLATSLLGNTLTIVEATGDEVVVAFNEDGTYVRNGASGKWEVRGDQICMTADEDGEEFCDILEPGHQPGETWEQANAAGETVTMILTEGQ